MDVRRLVTLVRGWLPLMLVAAVAAGAVAFAVSSLQAKVYEARATLIVGQALTAANPDYNQFLVAQNLSTTYAAIAMTSPVLQQVIEDLDLDLSPRQLSDRVSINVPRDLALLTITAQDGDPERAAEIANALAAELIATSPTVQGAQSDFQQAIQDDIDATLRLIESTQERVDALVAIEQRTNQQEAELQNLEDRLATLRATYVALLGYSSQGGGNILSVIEPAEAAAVPVAPTPLLNALLAAVLAVMVVFGVAFLAEQLDDSIRDPDVVMDVTELSTLASVERMRSRRTHEEIYRLAALLYPRSSAAEAYRALRSNIEFASVDTPLRTLLVTSAAPNEGKTVTAANLAVVYAQGGRKTLLVDADLRKPAVHEMFRLPNAVGLTSLLRDPSVGVTAVSQPTEEANLRVLTTGPIPPNPAELLGSRRMQTVLGHLQNEAEIVIFDSPPVQAVTDAAVLSSIVDGTILVVDASRSHRRSVRSARATLTRARASVLGAVLNGVPARPGSEYGEYYGPRSKDAVARLSGPETVETSGRSADRI